MRVHVCACMLRVHVCACMFAHACTLERATYSPICSLTRSFLRSMICRLPAGVIWPTSPVQK